MSKHSIEDAEQFSISELDLKNSSQLSRSITQVHIDLIAILTYFANHATDTPVESTHQIRKKLKFFRAFVKLLKLYHEDELFKHTNNVLRDFGRQFSGLRDAHVRSMMIDEFIKYSDLNRSALSLQILSKLNQNEINQIESKLLEPENVFLKFADELVQNDYVKQYLNIINPNPKIVLDTLIISYEKSAQSYHLAFESGDSEQFHEWRKRLKDVQYQYELLLKNLQDSQTENYTSVVTLCDHLGRINDLDMLNQWINRVQPNIKVPLVSGLSQYLSKLINDLHTKIKKLGKDLYTNSPY